jgi:hypothetical protein
MPRTPQPLHIFRKDLLHLWPETLVVLLLFAAFAWSAPSRWTGSENQIVGLLPLLGILLKFFLMPISWLVVISRVIQDEPLVGDRQFWTSRPYHWPSLLAAKVLYLVVFLYLPFLLMQVYLLKHAGLYPTTAIPALLHNLLLLTVIVVVPIAAISAITSTFPRALLAVVGAIVYIIVLSLGLLYQLLRHMPAPELQPIAIALFIALPLAALVLQYARRRTAVSRGILIATPLIIASLLLATPATALIRHDFPVASGLNLGDPPAEVVPHAPQAGDLVVFGGNVQLSLLLHLTGADRDSSYTIHGVSAALDAAGAHWSSSYAAGMGGRLSGGTPVNVVPVVLPVDVFNQFGHIPATLHLSLAIEQFKAEKPSTWTATRAPFAVPGHGICSFPANLDRDDAPTCRYPFSAPQINVATAPLSQACGDPSAPTRVGFTNISEQSTSLDFDPVVTIPMRFSFNGQEPAAGYSLCPGAKLSFTEAHSEGKSRLEVDQKGILLENYASHFPPHTRLQRPPFAGPENQ